MNTRIEFLYRDASNYKVYQDLVLEGELSEEQIQEILDNRYEDMWFIPDATGVEGVQFDDSTADDHPWFELYENSFSFTDNIPNCETPAQEFYEKYMDASRDWEACADDYWDYEKERTNTQITFMFKDKYGDSVYRDEVIEGLLSEQRIQNILDARHDGVWFLAGPVGLLNEPPLVAALKGHRWCKLFDSSFSTTSYDPTCDVTAEEFYDRFLQVSADWDAYTNYGSCETPPLD